MTGFDEDENQLISRVAWLYFHEELTQGDIGERLGLTRLKVNRLLQAGREAGLIRVVINTAFRDCVALEGELVRNFGLTRAIVVPPPSAAASTSTTPSPPSGEYASLQLRDGIASAWAGAKPFAGHKRHGHPGHAPSSP